MSVSTERANTIADHLRFQSVDPYFARDIRTLAAERDRLKTIVERQEKILDMRERAFSRANGLRYKLKTLLKEHDEYMQENRIADRVYEAELAAEAAREGEG